MVFTSSRRIDFPMVDLAGIAYYPRFWDLAHRFYEESWEHTCDMHYNVILNEHRIGFPLIHSEATFHNPLKYGDIAQCKLSIKEITNLIKSTVNAEVSPSQIVLKEDLNKIGVFKALINFHSEVKASISIKIDKIQSK